MHRVSYCRILAERRLKWYFFIYFTIFYSYTYGKGVEGSVHVKTSLVGKHRPAFLVDKPEAQQVEFDKPMSQSNVT